MNSLRRPNHRSSPIAPADRWGRSVAAGLLLGGMLMLNGCAWNDSARSPEPEPLPKLSDFPTSRPAGLPVGKPHPAPMRLHVDRLEVTADTDLPAIRQLAQRGTIPMAGRDLWRANGIVVGLMGPKALAEFQKTEMPILGQGRQLISCSQRWNVLTIYPAPPNDSPITMTLYRPDGRSRPVAIGSGRRQFLLSLSSRGPGGSTLLTIVPHHHQPKFSLMPRLSMEKELDGRRFDEMSLTVDLPADQCLLLMFDATASKLQDLLPYPLLVPEESSDRPTDESATPADTADKTNDAGEPKGQESENEPPKDAQGTGGSKGGEGPEGPGGQGGQGGDMGRLWLTGFVHGRASQTILLLHPMP